MAGAHPRSRGENVELEGHVGDVLGSSPLTRGKPMTPEARHASSGLIPAHAGKTVADLIDSKKTGAHPRSRGENDAPEAGE